MISRLHPSFRRDFAKLPRDIQRRAREAYRRFRADPTHPGLQFKPLHSTLPLWSVRVTESYRAVGVRRDDTIGCWPRCLNRKIFPGKADVDSFSGYVSTALNDDS